MSTSTKLDSNSNSKSAALSETYERSFPFFKSPEGEAEYKKIGMSYPRTMPDDWYDKFLRITKTTKKEEHKISIGSMIRHILANGEEYIVHDMREIKYDGLHNRKTFYRGSIGMYAIPIPKREIKARITEDEGMVQDIIQTVEGYDTGFSIPFNQKEIDKLIKYCDGNTQYVIRKMDYRSGQRFTIRSLNDWRNGKVEELLRFGHIASDYEKQILEDEKQGKYVTYPPAGNTGQYR